MRTRITLRSKQLLRASLQCLSKLCSVSRIVGLLLRHRRQTRQLAQAICATRNGHNEDLAMQKEGNGKDINGSLTPFGVIAVQREDASSPPALVMVWHFLHLACSRRSSCQALGAASNAFAIDTDCLFLKEQGLACIQYHNLKERRRRQLRLK